MSLETHQKLFLIGVQPIRLLSFRSLYKAVTLNTDKSQLYNTTKFIYAVFNCLYVTW